MNLSDTKKANVLQMKQKVDSSGDRFCDGCKTVIWENALFVEQNGKSFCYECVLVKAKQNARKLTRLEAENARLRTALLRINEEVIFGKELDAVVKAALDSETQREGADG